MSQFVLETAPKLRVCAGRTFSTAKQALLEQRLRGRPEPAGPGTRIPPRPPAMNPAPLSFAQQRLWFLDQLHPNDAVYNVSAALWLEGDLRMKPLRDALGAVVARHEVLRSRVTCLEGEPAQQVDPPGPVPFRYEDLRHWTKSKHDDALPILLRDEALRPFNLASEWPVRAGLFRTGNQTHLLLLVFHHIVSDAWSLGVFYREVSELYTRSIKGQPAPLPKLEIQYADFAVWQRGWLANGRLENCVEYWKKHLADVPPRLDLPLDFPRRSNNLRRAALEEMRFEKDFVNRLRTFSRTGEATVFMTLLAGFKSLLYRYSGQEDIVVGVPFSGRNRVETEALIGFFVNTLALRTSFSGEPSFREILCRVRSVALEACAHQDAPFEKLVEELRPNRSVNGTPWIQAIFAYQNVPVHSLQMGGIRATPLAIQPDTAKFDFSLVVTEDDGELVVEAEYDRDLFEPATIVRILQNWRQLLDEAMARPEQRVSTLPILNPAERRRVLSEWNETTADFPRNASIHRVFAEQVLRSPEAIAVAFQETRLTYRELDRQSSQCAARLVQAGVRPGDLVALLMDRCGELIITLLGILKAGAAYVALDSQAPPDRMTLMLEDLRPAALLLKKDWLDSHAGTADVLASLATREQPNGSGRTAIITLESEWFTKIPSNPAPVLPPDHPDGLAYVCFTSGSTGQPKGVCVTHRGVLRLACGNNFAELSPNETLLQLAPLSFDASTFEIWGALLNGGRLEVYPPGQPTIDELCEFIQSRGVTTLWLTAGLFHQVVEERLEGLRPLRQLLAGGDALSTPHVKRVRESLPHCRLINGYGPTESTTFACCHTVPEQVDPDRSIPIGKPIANTRVYVLDPYLQPVPIGAPGELFIGGDGLALGYLHQPALTAEKFIQNPFSENPADRLYRTGDRVRYRSDGNLEFLGRFDRQTKIRGFRVELGEIEFVLAGHSSVRECIVAAHRNESGETVLSAYLVAEGDEAVLERELRRLVQTKLPGYMMPASFVFLTVLPLKPNGKVDHSALPVPAPRRTARENSARPPESALERQLLQIWETTLGLDNLGVDENFFELGGHSLMAVRLAARIEKALGRRAPVATIFQFPTVALLATALSDASATRSPSSLVAIQPGGAAPPVYFVHGVGGGMFWGYASLSRHLGPNQPVFAFQASEPDGRPRQPGIEEMASSYVRALRQWQPSGPYFLGGYCFGGNVAFEMARQLTAEGHRVGMLALLNCAPPNTSYSRFSRTPAGCLRFLVNLAYSMIAILHWSPEQRGSFIKWKLRTLRRRAARWLPPWRGKTADSEVDRVVDLSALPEKQHRLWESHIRALMAYQPKTYYGEITLLRSRGHPLVCSFARDYGWGELAAGGVKVVIVPGNHESIMGEPYIKEVALRLQECLHAAQSILPLETAKP